ncbi:uncharacterized protein G2W53_029048 [Senna tora]|uniref:Uncharacterized protein n=1 Tax=Senna tora TaxID=362788 RepID=A0A834T3G2_9FABA|nr:uncharacterized protein G2W53_029048 [Senna tora]
MDVVDIEEVVKESNKGEGEVMKNVREQIASRKVEQWKNWKKKLKHIVPLMVTRPSE